MRAGSRSMVLAQRACKHWIASGSISLHAVAACMRGSALPHRARRVLYGTAEAV